MRYLIINGADTQDYGVKVMRIPPIQTPTRRYELITIPGRSGYLTQWDGSYETIDKTFSLFYNGSDSPKVAEFLLNAKRITVSNEPDKEYDCFVMNGCDITRALASWHQFEFTLTCQPLKREKTPLEITTQDSQISLINPGNHEAYPTITLYGTGDVTIMSGDQNILLTDISPSITLDGDLIECLQDSGYASHKMTGDFPVIKANDAATISWTGNVTKAVIKPNWRWV